MLRTLVLCVPLLGLLACASRAPTADPVAAAPSTYVAEAFQHQGVIIGGQPGLLDLQALPQAGVRQVFNLRTSEEMAGLDFDEAARLQQLGIAYSHHPIGGEAHPYAPALLDAFSAAMAAADGPLLLHCASGGRAAQLYAAWLVRERGFRPDEALRLMGPRAGWPMPMEKLLDRPLRLEFDEASRAPPSQR